MIVRRFDHWSGSLHAHVSMVLGDPKPVIEIEVRNTVVQAVSARFADTPTIMGALARTFLCLERGSSPAEKPDVAFLIHLSGERSFRKALDECAPGDDRFVLVVGGREVGSVRKALSSLPDLNVIEEFPKDEKARLERLPRVSLPSLK